MKLRTKNHSTNYYDIKKLIDLKKTVGGKKNLNNLTVVKPLRRNTLVSPINSN